MKLAILIARTLVILTGVLLMILGVICIKVYVIQK